MASKWDIDKWVEENAIAPYFSFYPSLPAKELNMNPVDVFLRLMELVNDGRLDYRCEFRCPECGSTLFRGITQDIPKDFLCGRCDLNHERDPEYITPVFSFNPEYVESLKKKSLY